MTVIQQRQQVKRKQQERGSRCRERREKESNVQVQCYVWCIFVCALRRRRLMKWLFLWREEWCEVVKWKWWSEVKGIKRKVKGFRSKGASKLEEEEKWK